MNEIQTHMINYMEEYIAEQRYDDFSTLEAWELLKSTILDALD